jgi:hypothetical protein
MKILFIFSLTCLSFFAQAEVSSSDVSQMLDQMVKDGTISKSEAAKAKIKMNGMSSEQWSTLNEQASLMAEKQGRGPASIKDMSASSNGNLDGAQFQQIKDDIKKMVPQYKSQE